MIMGELEYDHTVTPFECRMGWALDFDKGPFQGRDALLAKKDSVTGRVVSVVVDTAPEAAEGARLELDGRDIGYVTMAVPSPALDGATLGLARVHRDAVKSGTALTAVAADGIQGRRHGQAHARVRPRARPRAGLTRRRSRRATLHSHAPLPRPAGHRPRARRGRRARPRATSWRAPSSPIPAPASSPSVLSLETPEADTESLRDELTLRLARFDPVLTVRPEEQRRRVLLMVSQVRPLPGRPALPLADRANCPSTSR